ncbi:MAG: Ada metal-binding domain-containing protein [Mucilaginibacter sp.]
MIAHSDLGETPFGRARKLKELVDGGGIQFGGNKKLKIYGTLDCSSGKRMKIANRLFFKSENEALSMGFRPCGHCMRKEYVRWKLQ